MKQFLNVLILIIFWSVIFLPLYFFSKNFGIQITAFIVASYLLLLTVSLSYKHAWSLQTFNNLKGTITFFLILSVFFLILLYLTNLVFITHVVYKNLICKSDGNFKRIEYQPDKTLGYKPIPHARTHHIYKIKDKNIPTPKIPIAYDSNGFRIPLSEASKETTEHKKVSLLFLGCSFTFGAACYAEETFPFLVAKETHLAYINAGVSSYGLAHMLILAEKLIPQYKPDYVIIQYSPWLVTRSVNIYGPIDVFPLPTPYFAATNNQCVLKPPIYVGDLESIYTKAMQNTYKGSFFKFLFREAIPFSLREIWYYMKNQILLITGQLARPATNLKEVEKYAYNRIKIIAEKNGSTLIILNLGDLEYSKNSHNLFADKNIYFAEADRYLDEYLNNSPSKDYCMEFCHWVIDKKNLILIDRHLNPQAHRLIAKSIIDEIKKVEKKKN